MITTMTFRVAHELYSRCRFGPRVPIPPAELGSTYPVCSNEPDRNECTQILRPMKTSTKRKRLFRSLSNCRLSYRKNLLRQLRLESLEERNLFSLGGPMVPADILGQAGVNLSQGWWGLLSGNLAESAVGPESSPLIPTAPTAKIGPDQLQDFVESPGIDSAKLVFCFPENLEIRESPFGSYITLSGESLWTNPGDPIVPVRVTTLLLPAGTREVRVEVEFSGAGQVLEIPSANMATPTVIAVGQDTPWVEAPQTLPFERLVELEPVRFQTYVFRGFQLLSVQVFPVHWDITIDQLVYHPTVSVEILVDQEEVSQDSELATQNDPSANLSSFENYPKATLPPRGLPSDFDLLSRVVSNPSTVVTYGNAFPTSGSSRLPRTGSISYVIITSSDLEPVFRRLALHKALQGVSAEVVTVEYIQSRYSGLECGDLADRIREFITDAYLHWGTEWVLLGGDVETVPARGVYAQVGTIVEKFLPTDLYYACLDGPWDGNRNGIWGEPIDGHAAKDIDLVPEVFVGRAPVSNRLEAENFVEKIIQYETYVHPNQTTALWVGEQLDWRTEASYSGDIIRAAALPPDWQIIERYDRDRVWSGRELAELLNQSPHLVNHLGHASEDVNARLTVRDVENLRNQAPFFLYSQGCLSGAFDLRDVSIGEQYVVGAAGAFGVIMNTRYGWYVPGPIPGGNHFYALEFWDAVFNERLFQVGLAHHDARMDNLFRVGTTGVYRWIHFGTVLLGDPEVPFQVSGSPRARQQGSIAGRVLSDVNRDGQPEANDLGLESILVYLDLNADGRFNQGTLTTVFAGPPTEIPDAGILRSVLPVSASGKITDIVVRLDLEHQYLHDLEAYLVSPSGHRVKLFSRIPAAAGDLSQVCFSDNSDRQFSLRQTNYSGTFRPAEPLASFRGQEATGTWVLEILDLAPADSGILRTWGLEITFEEPHTLTGPDGQFVFHGLSQGEYVTRIVVPGGWEVVLPADELYRITLQESNQPAECLFLVAPQPWPPQAEDWGILRFREVLTTNLEPNVRWFRFRTDTSGICTILARPEVTQPQTLELEIFDAHGTQVASGILQGTEVRLDLPVSANEELYLRVKTKGAPVRIIAANVLGLAADRVEVVGTQGPDLIEITLNPLLTVTINGLDYHLPSSAPHNVRVVGSGDGDILRILGSSSADTVVVADGTVRWNSTITSLRAEGFSTIELAGGADTNRIWLYGSGGDDRLISHGDDVIFHTAGVQVTVRDFQRIGVFAGSGGADEVRLNLPPGASRVFFRAGEVTCYSPRWTLTAKGFPSITVASGQGAKDSAYFLDSPAADIFDGFPTHAIMIGTGFVNRAEGFRWVVARSSRGLDHANLYDSSGRDELVATVGYAVLSGSGYYIRVEAFSTVVVTASGGTGDFARLFDSPENDLFHVAGTSVRMITSTSQVLLTGFDNVRIYSGRGGTDAALVEALHTTSQVQAMPGWVRVNQPNFEAQLTAVSHVRIRGTSPPGRPAFLYDSAIGDTLTALSSGVWLANDRFGVLLEDFAHVRAISRFGAKLVLAREPLDYVLETTGSWLAVG